MKRLTVLSTVFLLGLFLSAPPAKGQVDVQPGIRAGVDFMTLGGDTEVFQQAFGSDAGRRTGFMAGGFLVVDWGGILVFQPEAMYIQKGWTQTANIQGGELSITGKLDYIEVPALLKVQIPVNGALSPNIFAGPNIGFNVTSEIQVEGGGQSQNQDFSDSVSSIDYGLTFGGGFDFDLGRGALMVDARYQLGLANIDDSDEDVSFNNQGFMVTAGFAF